MEGYQKDIESKVHNSDTYVMEMDQENRNCHNCGRFGYMVKHCRNWETENRIKKERKLKYRKNRNSRQQRIVKKRNRHNLNGD